MRQPPSLVICCIAISLQILSSLRHPVPKGPTKGISESPLDEPPHLLTVDDLVVRTYPKVSLGMLSLFYDEHCLIVNGFFAVFICYDGVVNLA